jgi:hypothetical protein
VVLVPLPGGVSSVGVDGVSTREANFLLYTFFVLGALALAAKWSSQATCLVVIASKPPNLKPIPAFANKGSGMRNEREVWEVTWMRRV